MVHRCTSKRRRRRPAALFCLLATTSLFQWTNTNVVNDDGNSNPTIYGRSTTLIAHALSFSPSILRPTATSRIIHRRFHNLCSGPSNTGNVFHDASDVSKGGNNCGSSTTTALFAGSRVESNHPSAISDQTARPNSRSDGQNHQSNNKNDTNNFNYKGNNNNANGHEKHQHGSWLDRTTAQILDMPLSEVAPKNNGRNRNNQHHHHHHHHHQLEQDSIPTGQLTPDDVALITTLMTSHARRSTVESALICERLLKRVVEEVNAGNNAVRVTTKMYTVAMDAWAKSQRRPLPGSGLNSNNPKDDKAKKRKGGEDRKRNEGPYGFEGKKLTSDEEQRHATKSIIDNANKNSQHTKDQRRDSLRKHQRKQQHQQTRQTQQQLQLHPQQDPNTSKLSQLPLGAAAQRAHRIHNSLVQTHKETGDVHLAPSTISYNAAINAWSKSYHPSAGEMAEALLGEMMREWRFGEQVRIEGDLDENGVEGFDGEGDEEIEDDDTELSASDAANSTTSEAKPKKIGNERVKPDVVTFTAVIDAWVKCTALAHDYHYERPPTASTSENTDAHNNKNNTSNYIDWKRSQASKADELTQRAAKRAKQLLELMIVLGHYDPERHGVEAERERNENPVSDDGDGKSQDFPLTKCEPGMRPNCYTYSAAMNALAKSCSALRAHGGGRAGNNNNNGLGQQRGRQQQQQQYDPAREAQDMLENMIVKHERYKERLGESGIWKANGGSNVGYGTGRTSYPDDGVEDSWMPEVDNDGENDNEGDANYEDWMRDSWSSSSLENIGNETSSSVDKIEDGETFKKNPHWFDPRPDELTFPPNTINYNSVLNAWSRASRYEPMAAQRAEQILLERMEMPQNEGGDNVEPDALSYSLVIHAWLRGCRGFNANNNSGGAGNAKSASRQKRQSASFTDQHRIERAMNIVERLETWARRTHISHKWQSGDEAATAGGERSNKGGNSGEEDSSSSRTASSAPSYNTFRQPYNKARDLDVEVYNSILVAYSREQSGDHANSVFGLLDRMESLAVELDMPSVRPNMRSYNVALGVISNSATRANISLAQYYKDADDAKRKRDEEKREAELASETTKKLSGSRKDRSNQKNKAKTNNNRQKPKPKRQNFNPLYAGRAAESILSRMLLRDFRPDSYTFASVLNTYQRIPNGRLDAALSADAVVRGMESLYLHGRIDEPPDVFHYTMVCACWSRSGERGVAGERCSEILKHMQERDQDGFPRVRPNIRTYNAVIDSHAYNGRVAEAEDMLLSMVDNYESSASRSMDGIEDEELPVRPDSFSFNTVIQQWARSRTPEGGLRAEKVLDRMLKFHHDGNADVRPDERSFAYIIYHFTKGAGRMSQDAPDRAYKLLQRMIGMYREGYKELLPLHQNKTNPIFAFTSVVDAHSVLRRPDSGSVGDELLEAMTKLGSKIESLRPNTYACLSVLYGWSSCGSVNAGERATALLQKMEDDMYKAAEIGEESIMRTTQRCYILAQTAWARSPSDNKAEGALKVLEMMEKNYIGGNMEAKPTVQAYSMVLNACAFADMVQDRNKANGRLVKASRQDQQKAFHIAELTMDRIRKEPFPGVRPNPIIYGSFIKCCGRLDLPSDTLASDGAIRAFGDCCRAGLVSDFVLTQLRYALSPAKFLGVLAKNGFDDLDRRGKSLSRDGQRIRHIRVSELPKEWTRNANADNSQRNSNR